jgi:subtilisin family serine protease
VIRWLAIALVAALLAPAAAPAAPLADGDEPDVCRKQAKRLKTFKRGMKEAKKRFFRTHRSAKARKRFVRAQHKKLVKLQRALEHCRNQPAPQPQPSPGPAPPAPPRFVPHDVSSARALAAPAEISRDGDAEIIRTQLELDLRPDATAAAVESLLRRLDAEVVSSLAGVGLLTVRIPDPGSLTALDALIASLAGDPALERAGRVGIPVTEDLPELILPGDSDVVRPQLAVRAHAAWNARAALAGSGAPALLVGDHFGAGAPSGAVGVSSTAADFATGNPNPHGYMVLGLLAGAFDPLGLSDARADRVTGLWAGPPLTLRAVDISVGLGGPVLEDRMIAELRNLPGNVVVNTSLGSPCAASATGCSLADGIVGSQHWIEKVRAAGLEDRVLHVSAAGNIRPHLPTHTDARLNSSVNAAALLPMAVDNLRNTLVVENAIASPTDVARPLCLRNSSKRGGQIAAVGSDITSLDGPASARFVNDGGTSAATPQVAGAAAGVWALDPSLTSAQVIARLLATARPATGTDGDPRCAATAHAPALDAYAALLAADDAAAAPARAAVLDPVDANGDEVVPTNGRFDEKDLAAFVAAFDAANGDADYGRYDLNGDGATGGDGVDRFDLDASSPPAWDFSARRPVLGVPIRHAEEELTDLDVLCYEAAGPLYRGDTAVRDQFFAERCLPPAAIDVQFPAFVSPGVSHALRISVRRTDMDDVLPGVHLELTVAGGTVGDFGGVTDPDGLFATTGRMFAGQAALTIEIIARAGEAGPELARTTVHALPEADAALLGLWSGVSECDAPATVPLQLRITRGVGAGSAPLEASITQAGSNTGAIRQEFFALARQADGTYEGTSMRDSSDSVLRLAEGPLPRSLSGHVTGADGRCQDYDFLAQFVSN